MNSELKTILTRNHVCDEVQGKMVAVHCISAEDLANWVEERKELKATFLQGASVADDSSQFARLKMAFRQADALVSRKLKRSSEGLTEEPLDDPLEEGVQKTVEDTFSIAYNWKVSIPPKRMGTDILLGRVYREFVSSKVTLYALDKVKSLASVQSKVTGTAKRRCGDRMAIVFGGQEDDEPDVSGSVLDLLSKQEVLGNTWAVAGSFEVAYDGSQVIRSLAGRLWLVGRVS